MEATYSGAEHLSPSFTENQPERPTYARVVRLRLPPGGTILGAESRKFAGFSVWPVLRPRCLTALQIGDLCNDPTPEIRLMFLGVPQ